MTRVIFNRFAWSNMMNRQRMVSSWAWPWKVALAVTAIGIGLPLLAIVVVGVMLGGLLLGLLGMLLNLAVWALSLPWRLLGGFAGSPPSQDDGRRNVRVIPPSP